MRGRLLDEGSAREIVASRDDRAREAELYAARLRDEWPGLPAFADRIEHTSRLLAERLGPPHRRGYRKVGDEEIAEVLAELDFNARVVTKLREQAEEP